MLLLYYNNSFLFYIIDILARWGTKNKNLTNAPHYAIIEQKYFKVVQYVRQCDESYLYSQERLNA